MQSHTNRTRDAALRRLALANRWLIAASAAVTGLFTALAAHAFPGRKLSAHAPRASHTGKVATSSSQSSPKSPTQSLKPPQQAPQTTTTQSEQAPQTSTETEHERVTTTQSTPPAEESAPAAQSEPTHSETSAPTPETPAVVSGGS